MDFLPLSISTTSERSWIAKWWTCGYCWRNYAITIWGKWVARRGKEESGRGSLWTHGTVAWKIKIGKKNPQKAIFDSLKWSSIITLFKSGNQDTEKESNMPMISWPIHKESGLPVQKVCCSCHVPSNLHLVFQLLPGDSQGSDGIFVLSFHFPDTWSQRGHSKILAAVFLDRKNLNWTCPFPGKIHTSYTEESKLLQIQLN